MKKLSALLVSLLLAVGSTLKANTYSDNNPADVYINALHPSYTGEFTLAGYDSSVETVVSGFAEFTLWDLQYLGGSESVRISFSDQLFTSGSFGGFITLGGGLSAAALFTLDTTGALSYTVSRNDNSIWSEFWLKNAYLEVQTAPRNVPDSGATAAMLGLGLMGLFLAARRAKN